MAKARPIFIPGTNRQFSSASAAAKALGIDAGNIYKVLKGQRKTAGGYAFGYESNKTIYVPQTGQTFASASEAAKSLGVRKNRVQDVLGGRGNRQTVGGYNFVYADTTKLSPASEQAAPPPRKNANKQQRIQQHRAKKQARFAKQQQREAERKEERAAAKERQKQRDAERQRMRNQHQAADELRRLMESINSQLIKYQNANMMGYSQIAQDVEEFQNYLGFTDDGLFDTSDENMFVIMATMSTDDINQWKKQLDAQANSKKGLFWDLNKQIKERQNYALEFGVSPEEMDAYIDLLPDLWKIFEQARHYSIYEKVHTYIWTEIKNSVRSGINPQELKKVMGELSKWNGSSSKELQEILSELEASIYLESIFDDDDLPF